MHSLMHQHHKFPGNQHVHLMITPKPRRGGRIIDSSSSTCADIFVVQRFLSCLVAVPGNVSGYLTALLSIVLPYLRKNLQCFSSGAAAKPATNEKRAEIYVGVDQGTSLSRRTKAWQNEGKSVCREFDSA